ncbi:alpha-1,3-mannosyl-glycoprotein 2-beta-N-acetylglucosaminyltransferase isoform X1 [Anticarsia gemmatalis]|uniref:alpha-1,3-mannosyl-glycoprotein 2-beta-N-acetylglucosaminyltransferase isoform X1 n=1 Tax=Anticarsia gemmatalis TaxID=129554 RepID=UPI003F760697
MSIPPALIAILAVFAVATAFVYTLHGNSLMPLTQFVFSESCQSCADVSSANVTAEPPALDRRCISRANDDIRMVPCNLPLVKPCFEHKVTSNTSPKCGQVDAGTAALVLPVLVIACDRVTVKRCLDNLVKFRPNKDTFPIIVSQDCGHNATYHVIKAFTDMDPTIKMVQQPDLKEITLPRAKVKFRGYYKIARHFKFALNHVFETLGHEAVIIVEDDLDISPDFFEYFLGTYPLLLKDPSLWCISAWNDNGKKEVIDMSRPELLHRTDFFPGLGWLLRRETWFRLAPKWPAAFFDDWLRNPDNIDGKSCIRPEVSRTYSFGKVGVSKGLFFDIHLRNIQLNYDYVEFTKLNLTYLLKENYDADLASTIYTLPEMTADEVMMNVGTHKSVKVMYGSAKSYQRAAKKMGLMDDFRSGVPRTAYRGIVSCFVRGRRVYLAPDFTWTRYDPAWG